MEGLTPLQRCSRCILQPQPIGQVCYLSGLSFMEFLSWHLYDIELYLPWKVMMIMMRANSWPMLLWLGCKLGQKLDHSQTKTSLQCAVFCTCWENRKTESWIIFHNAIRNTVKFYKICWWARTHDLYVQTFICTWTSVRIFAVSTWLCEYMSIGFVAEGILVWRAI